MSRGGSWSQFQTARRARIAYWLRAVGSRASVAQAEIWLGEQPSYIDIARRWDGLDDGQREEAAKQLAALFRAAAYATRPFCIRCGNCCRNAAPTLYPGDEGLLQSGKVTHAHLRTLRAGEEVFDHWQNRNAVLDREIVMISPTLDGRCPLYDAGQRACTAHELRPAQCRAQKCWDTADADKLRGWSGLKRVDLLDEEDPLRDSITEHDRVCAPARLRELAERLKEGDEAAAQPIVDMVAEDERIRRQITVGLAPADALPFLLGRPLEMLLSPLGLERTRGWDSGVGVRTKAPSTPRA